MSIKDTLNNDIKDCMRAKDAKKLSVLRQIAAAVKQVEVDERISVDDSRMTIILDKMAKQRRESIEQFQTASRIDLVEQEEYELSILSNYLPEPFSEVEINNIVEQTITELAATAMGDMGRVMAKLKPILQGRADMSKVSALIKAKLS